jgi:hypothetical protein
MATTSQVVTSSLPAGFEPFYKTGLTAAESPTGQAIKGLIPQAFGLYGKGEPKDFKAQYIDPLQSSEGGSLYGAGRIAGLSPYQTQIGTQLSAMTTPGQFASGTGALGSGYLAASGLPSMLTPGQIQEYMSPYAQSVIDVQKTKAIEDAQKAQLGENLAAARRGTYGGSRQLIAQTERERALAQGLGDIQARGLQSAYEAAQKGLEAERAARLQQAQTYGTLGAQFGGLGVQQQAADIDRLKTLGAYGDLERAIAQQKIDARYQDLMRGIEFPEQQLAKLSGFIRGIPLTEQTTTTTTPPPSFASQLAGLGLSGLSLYNLANKG